MTGHSLVVTIPIGVVSYLDLQPGDEFGCRVVDDEIHFFRLVPRDVSELMD